MHNELARWRFERGRMSQHALAHKTGLYLRKVWAIENGYQEPSPDDQRKLAAALNVDIATLFPPTPDADATSVPV